MAIVLLPLTQTQEAVLAYVWIFYMENDQLPPTHMVSEKFGWKSKNAAADVMAALSKKGYVEKNTVGKHRFTSLFHAEQRLKELAEEGAV